jgi:hypothetical protein
MIQSNFGSKGPNGFKGFKKKKRFTNDKWWQKITWSFAG